MNSVQRYQQSPSAADTDIHLVDLLAIVRRRRLLIGAILLTSLAIGIALTLLLPKTWEAQAQMIMVQPVLPNGAASVQYNTGPLLQTIETVETQLGMLQSDAMASRAIMWLRKEAAVSGKASNSVTIDADTLSQKLTVVNPKNSSVLNVSVKADNPDQAALWTNAVCAAFVEWKSEESEHSARTAVRNLELQAAKSKLLSEHADAQLVAFKNRYHIVDSNAQHQGAMSMLQAREADIEVLTQQLMSDNARIAAFKAQIRVADKSIRTGTGVRDDGLVLALQTQLSALETQRSDAATQYTPYYPGVLHGIDAKINAARKQLTQAIQGTLDNKRPSLQEQGAMTAALRDAQVEATLVQAKLNSALAQRAQQQGAVIGLPQQDMHLAQLQRAADLGASQYLGVKAALNSAQLGLAQVTQNIQITQWATPPVLPATPKPLLNLAVSLALGLLLATIAAGWKELTDRRLHTVEAVQMLGVQPVIGLLPKLSWGQRFQMQRGGVMPHLDAAINQARGNMSLLGCTATNAENSRADAPYSLESLISQMECPQVLLVTSTSHSEGKSFVAAQLAHSLAQSGKSVTLVDANPQRPAKGAVWANPTLAAPGIQADGEQLEDAHPLSDQVGLTTLRGAAYSGVGADFFNLHGLAKMTGDLRQKSDVIILDGPDCVSTREVFSLAAVSDLIVHVVRIDRGEAEAVADATAILAGTRKSVGIIVNGATRADRNHYRNRPLLLPGNAAPAPRVLEMSPALRVAVDQADGTGEGTNAPRSQNLSVIKTA